MKLIWRGVFLISALYVAAAVLLVYINVVISTRNDLRFNSDVTSEAEEHDDTTDIPMAEIEAMVGRQPNIRRGPRRNFRDNAIPDEWFKEMQKRKDIMSEVCRRYKKTKPRLTADWLRTNTGNLIVENKYKIIYCRVPKSGNTNWKRLLLALSGITEDEDLEKKGMVPKLLAQQYLETVDQLPPEEARGKLDSYLKVMFLRHPIERLLSAYRNKLEKYPLMHRDILQEVAPYVMREYRGTEAILPVRMSTGKGRMSGVLPSGKTFDFKKDEPPSWVPRITFEEFLRYIGDHPSDLNEHWAPPDDLCHPCAIQYDVIGYFGTIGEDARNILKMAHAYPAFHYPEVKVSNVSTSAFIQKYYSTVDRVTLNRIGQLYALDAEMSGSKIYF